MRHIFLLIICLSGSLATAQQSQPKSVPPCSAGADAPKTFWGFWNPKPSKSVNVTINFNEPDAGVEALDCIGEPLEITVPNGQNVTLITHYDPKRCKTSSTAVSVTKANTDSPVADVLSILAKVGAFFAIDQGGQSYLLPPQTNKIVSIDATCSIADGRKSTQNVKITYQNPPRVVVSAGVLFAHGVTSYGTNTSQTGVDSGGVSTSQTLVAVSGSPAAQVIPFGLVNIFYSGSRQFNLNAQLGVGVNPNLSSARVEYFASPFAIGWHDVYISPGVHIGQHEQIAGGFHLGQLTPSAFKLPLKWEYYTAFGFSISYNLKPLAKSGSK